MTIAERPTSPIDYAEQLRRFVIPPENKPYILARFALAHYPGNANEFANHALSALNLLHNENEKGELSPPLEDILADEIAYFTEINGNADTRRYSNPASAMLLSWALESEARGLARG